MIFIVASWVLTLAFIAFYLRAHRRLVLVARATHELRGPLFAMQLGLHGLGGEPARVAALELELRRAGRALDDLAAAPSGARAETSRELVDLTELVESYAPAWRTLASGYGAELRVEPPLLATRLEGGEAAASGCSWPRRRAARETSAKPALRAAPATPAAPTPPATPAAPASPAVPAAIPAAPVVPAAPASPAAPVSPGAIPAAPVVPAAPATPAAPVAPTSRATSASLAVAATVFADPLRIAQACANLIGNAAEHGGGVVRVRVRAGGTHVRIEVSDDGPGLPMGVTALTVTARTRRGRRGHGLAIAAAIAEHHGGRLHAAPSDRGARLMLEMPAAGEPAVA